MTNADAILRMEGIVKAFSGVRALDGVDFDVRAGEVHALIGENGAGKSTLMNVLAGRFGDYQGRTRWQLIYREVNKQLEKLQPSDGENNSED